MDLETVYIYIYICNVTAQTTYSGGVFHFVTPNEVLTKRSV